MSWVSLHNESQRLAVQAREMLRSGDTTSAEKLYAAAAEQEDAALHSLDPAKSRTYGITAVSCAALWFKSGRLEIAAERAHAAMARSDLAAFARENLREILQSIWNRETQIASGLTFSDSQLIVSVKGGEILTGGAPLDLIVRKAREIQGLLMRTVEYLSGKPLRRRGSVSKDILDHYRPWIFQTAPGSYRFIVSLQEPKQLEMFARSEVTPTQATDKLMSILEATTNGDPEELERVVPATDYRKTFTKLVRALGPRGNSFDRIEIGRSQDEPPVVLARQTMEWVSLAGPPQIAYETQALEGVVELSGTLRALHLDDDWLEVLVEDQPIRVKGLTDVVDDVIGPMVNHKVVVRAKRVRKAFQFVDIDLA